MRSRLGLLGVWLAAVLGLAQAVPEAKSDPRIVEAAARQDWAAIHALAKQGVDVNSTWADGATALLWAAHWDNLSTASLLLGAGANANAATDSGVTPLDLAAENASVAMVDKLLSAGANPNLPQIGGLTALMIAAHTGNVQIVRSLLARGAEVQAATKETRNTALMWAVSDHFPEIVKALLDAHADVHASTTNGLTPLLYAAQNGDIPTAQALIAAGVNVNEAGSDGTRPLPYAILRGRGEFALFLLDQGADPNAGMGGVRALHAAAGSAQYWLTDWSAAHSRENGGFLLPAMRLRLVKELLARGADPNARTTTSGMMMYYLGHPRKGAFEPFSCGTGDMRGATPLWVAANSASGNQLQLMEIYPRMFTDGYPEIIRALLAGGADLHITTEDGTTALMAAAGLGGATFTPGQPRGFRDPNAEAAVRILVEAGADVNAVNEADFTALHGAAFRGFNEVIEYLVKQGAKIDARDFRGRTPYRIAEGAKQSFQFQAFPETAALLKKLGANPKLGIPGTIQERAPREVAAAGSR